MRKATIGLAITALALALPSEAQVLKGRSAADRARETFTGTWRAMTAMGGVPVQIELVVQPSGIYSETERSPAIMTMQTGEIREAGAGMVAFVVENWEPRTMPQYHATGTVGGYYTQVPTSKPPGGVWRYRFDGPNSVTMQDANFGGVVTFQRVG